MTLPVTTRPALSDPPTSPANRQTRHIGFLDHIRGVAIIAVFLYHAIGAAYTFDQFPWVGWHRQLPDNWIEWLVAPARFGWAGVAIFFVVSGFCIHLSFMRKPEWKDFFVRRFFRIYPPYFLALLAFAFILPTTRLNLHDKHDLVQLVSHLALVHNFGNTTALGINGVFWSIAVEVQLYLLYPLLLILANRFGWKSTLYWMAGAEVLFRVGLHAYLNVAPGEETTQHVPRMISANPLNYWFEWSIGAYLAEEYLRGRELPFAKLSGVALILAAICTNMLRPVEMFSFTLFSLWTATIIAQLLANEKLRWKLPEFLSNRLAETGLWSYSIYLLHVPITFAVWLSLRTRLPAFLNHPPIMFCFLLGTWLLIKPVSGLWYYLFELKGIALGKRVARSLAPV